MYMYTVAGFINRGFGLILEITIHWQMDGLISRGGLKPGGFKVGFYGIPIQTVTL